MLSPTYHFHNLRVHANLYKMILQKLLKAVKATRLQNAGVQHQTCIWKPRVFPFYMGPRSSQPVGDYVVCPCKLAASRHWNVFAVAPCVWLVSSECPPGGKKNKFNHLSDRSVWHPVPQKVPAGCPSPCTQSSEPSLPIPQSIQMYLIYFANGSRSHLRISNHGRVCDGICASWHARLANAALRLIKDWSAVEEIISTYETALMHTYTCVHIIYDKLFLDSRSVSVKCQPPT